MFGKIIVLLSVIAIGYGKPSVLAPLAAAPVVTSHSSQVITRNHNAFAAPIVAPAPLAAYVAPAPVARVAPAPVARLAAAPVARLAAAPVAEQVALPVAYNNPLAAYSAYNGFLPQYAAPLQVAAPLAYSAPYPYSAPVVF